MKMINDNDNADNVNDNMNSIDITLSDIYKKIFG